MFLSLSVCLTLSINLSVCTLYNTLRMGLYLTIFAGVILLIISRTMFVCLSVLLYLCLCVPVLDYWWCYRVDYCIKFQVSSIYIYLTVPFSLNICICLSICVYLFWTTAGVILLIISRSRFVSRAGDITCLHFAPLKIKKNINKSLSTLFHNAYRTQLID